MNALVTGAELAQLLRPDRPWTRETIHQWTVKGIIPRAAVIHNGRRLYYSVPRLRAAGWLPEATSSDARTDPV